MVSIAEKKYTMTRLELDGTTFGHHKFALYVTDVIYCNSETIPVVTMKR